METECYVSIMFFVDGKVISDYDIVKRTSDGLKLLASSRGNWAMKPEYAVETIEKTYKESLMWDPAGGYAFVRLLHSSDYDHIKSWKYVSEELGLIF